MDLARHRTDDAPAYFTILIVGHMIVPMVLVIEKSFAPPLWLQTMVWVPLTLALVLLILPRIKGAMIGVQWATRSADS